MENPLEALRETNKDKISKYCHGILSRAKEKVKQNDFLFITLPNLKENIIYIFNILSGYSLERKKFYKKLGYDLDLKNPKSFNQKIVWKKINDRNPLLPVTADKYRVRDYIKETLGEEKAKEILIPLLHVTDKPETIPFDKLPNEYVIKPTHASQRVIIVQNNNYNKEEIIKKCARWLKTPYGLADNEWAYQKIPRKIIIEELLRDDAGNVPTEFKFLMFHGKCRLVRVLTNQLSDLKVNHYTADFKPVMIEYGYYKRAVSFLEKPPNYDQMLKLAERLSVNFDFLRVDLYSTGKKIYFGELTHYSGSGLLKYEPRSFDFELGSYWNLT
jgi:hypothetical protein